MSEAWSRASAEYACTHERTVMAIKVVVCIPCHKSIHAKETQGN